MRLCRNASSASWRTHRHRDNPEWRLFKCNEKISCVNFNKHDRCIRTNIDVTPNTKWLCHVDFDNFEHNTPLMLTINKFLGPIVFEHNVNSLKCILKPWFIKTTRCVNKTMDVVHVIIFKIINWPTNNKTFSN